MAMSDFAIVGRDTGNAYLQQPAVIERYLRQFFCC